jgi:hypothetical protein
VYPPLPRRPSRTLLLATALLFCNGAHLSAQPGKPPRDPNFRNLTGTVFLPGGEPAVGAIVKLRNLKTLQILSYITQEDGRYQFNNLSTTIDYEVRAEYEELVSKKRGLSVFDQRAQAVIDLKLAERKKPKSRNP